MVADHPALPIRNGLLLAFDPMSCGSYPELIAVLDRIDSLPRIDVVGLMVAPLEDTATVEMLREAHRITFPLIHSSTEAVTAIAGGQVQGSPALLVVRGGHVESVLTGYTLSHLTQSLAEMYIRE